MEVLLILGTIGAIGIAAAILDRIHQVWHFGSGFLLLIALGTLLWLTVQLDRFVAFTPGFNIAMGAGHMLVFGMPVVIVAYLATKAILLFTWPRE